MPTENVLVSIYDNAGVPKADATPTFVSVRDTTGGVQPNPIISNVGNGDYAFPLDGNTGYAIATGAAPMYVAGGIGDGVWFALYNNDGSLKADAVPTARVYSWSGGLLATPSVLNAGSGLYYFTYAYDSIFKVTTGCMPAYLDGCVTSYTPPEPIPTPGYIAPDVAPATENFRDRQCNFATGKFALSNNSFSFVSGTASVRQACEIALNTFLGTYFLDSTVGMPYFQKVFVRNPNKNDIIFSIRSILTSIPGIISVTSITIGIVERVATITWSAKATNNIAISGTLSVGE